MRLHVEIPHGCFVVTVNNPSAWRAIKWGFFMRRVPFKERKFVKSMLKDHPVLSEADLLLLATTDPHNRVRMKEMHQLLGLVAP